VATYAGAIAEALHLGRRQVRRITLAAQLHDLGKQEIPAALINKPGRLDDAERTRMQTHPSSGARRVRHLLAKGVGRHLLAKGVGRQTLRVVAAGLEAHHESYDGTGYPRGLAGQEIPLSARIIAVADVVDALASARSYRGALPLEVVVDHLRAGAGTQFDPRMVNVFLGLLKDPRVEAALRAGAADRSAVGK